LSDLAIIGAGSWGTALSIVLAPRFRRVRLWAYDPGLADQIRTTRENTPYLPGFQIAENVVPTDDLAEALDNASIVLLVIPTQFLRKVFQRMVPMLHPQTALVSAAKGIENGSLLRMSQVLEQEAARRFPARVAVLSGPTFAREIANGQPAAVAISGDNHPKGLFRSQLSALHQLGSRGRGDRSGVEERNRDRGRHLSRAGFRK
jgi:glycerol-3-phosphate dehydrogenase (NAD(P)+)